MKNPFGVKKESKPVYKADKRFDAIFRKMRESEERIRANEESLRTLRLSVGRIEKRQERSNIPPHIPIQQPADDETALNEQWKVTLGVNHGNS
jgi:hypothetical protein